MVFLILILPQDTYFATKLLIGHNLNTLCWQSRHQVIRGGHNSQGLCTLSIFAELWKKARLHLNEVTGDKNIKIYR